MVIFQKLISELKNIVISIEAILTYYTDVVQYEALIKLPEDFFNPEAKKRRRQTDMSKLEDLVKSVNEIKLGPIVSL